MLYYLTNTVFINIGRRNSITILPMPSIFFTLFTLFFKVLLFLKTINLSLKHKNYETTF